MTTDASMTSPQIAVVAVEPAQGPVGPAGPQGPMGSASSGFGYVQYMEVAAEVGATLDAGVRVPLAMTIDATQTSNNLVAPFLGFAFFDGTTMRARRSGDAYDLRFTMTVTASVAGGSVSLDLTINGATTLTDSDSTAMSAPAGVPQRLAFRLKVFPKSGFASSGAQFYVTSTVPATIRSESLVVEPISAAP